MSYRNFVILMALIMGLSPFAVDAYLPAIPSMAEFLGVGTDRVATTISCYVFGMAAGQLVGGPLSDHYGRKALILWGLVIYILAALVITQAESLLTIQLSRILQAIGAGFASVCIAPLVRDRAVGNDAAKIFSLIGLVMVSAPAIAPSVGALILYKFEWQGIFYFLVLFATIVVGVASFSLPKDKPAPSTNNLSSLKRYSFVLSNKIAVRYMLVQSLAFSVMLVFMTNSSFVYQEYYGVSESTFAIILAINVLVMAVFNRINNYYLNRIAAQKLLRYFLLFQLASIVALMLLVSVGASIWWVGTCITFTLGSLAGIMPNATAMHISCFSEHTGSAAALAGAGMFLVASILSGFSTLILNGSLWPIMLVMLSIAIIANLITPNARGAKIDST